MAIFLHIETATQVCSVALSESGKIISARESREKNIHSSIITVFIEEMMREAGIPFSSLDAVVVSKGPGSYTGLRIGVSTAKGICYGLGKPLIAIGTLESMAAGMISEMESRTPSGTPSLPLLLCPMIDARRMEVYNGLFDYNLRLQRDIRAEIITDHSFSDLFEDHTIWFAGDGAEKCRPFLASHPNARFMEDFFPSAAHMLQRAEAKFEKSEFENVAYFEPFYLKDFIPGIPRVKGLSF